MTHQTHACRLAPLLATLIVLTAATVDAQQPPRGFADAVLGRWDLTIHDPDGDYPSWLEIRLRTERQLMGRLVGNYGSVRHVTKLNFMDGQLEVRVPVQYEGHGGDLVFDGRLEDDRLTGWTTNGSGETIRWSGVRAPLLARDTPPVWGEPVSLINAADMAGWRQRSNSHPGCWTVESGTLTATDPCVDLISVQEFDDFRLHVEFRYPPGGNSGVYLRGRYEVQIQDDQGKALDALRLGGVYGFIAPTEDAARAAGEWQAFDVTLVGRRITVVLNGTEIISDRVVPGITGGALDSDEGAPGPLMLQGDHGTIHYRNIVVIPAL